MKINRCPKCGREPVEVKYSSISRKVIGYKILCDFCFTTSGVWKTRPKAIAKWNEITKGVDK
jgi:hypothetical protein